jgi:hypothetical protein
MTTFNEYIEQFGCHFNKRLYEWAVSLMTDRKGEKIKPRTQQQVEEFLGKHGIKIDNNKGWDAAYVLAMGAADYIGSSIPDEAHLAKFVKDFLDDPDGSKTKAFDHFVVDCRAKREPIFWDMMM